MNHIQLFRAALMEPKKQAASRILPIGKIMQFVFLLILLLSLVSFAGLLGGLSTATDDVDGLLAYIEEIEWLLYPFALFLLFVTTTTYHFVKISLFAFLGVGFLSLRKKKGEYRHMWRTAALAVTWPTILSFLLSLAGAGLWVSLLSALLTAGYLWSASGYYPNLPKPRPAVK